MFREILAFFSQMLQNLQHIAKFQKIQLDNLVDFEKCYKTRIYLQRSAPIQPKTNEILPKICQELALTLRVQPWATGGCRARGRGRAPAPRDAQRGPDRGHRAKEREGERARELDTVCSNISRDFEIWES